MAAIKELKRMCKNMTCSGLTVLIIAITVVFAIMTK